MKRKIIPFIGLLASSISFMSFTQNCNCTYTIDTALANGISLAPWRTGIYHFNPPPGSVICLKGIYRDLRIDGISGTVDSPIIIKNSCDSIAKFVSTSVNPPLSLVNSQYVHITGAGVPSKYGITIDCNGYAGISVSGSNVRNIEIDNVEVKKTSYAGFMIKQDPSCDSNTWLDSTSYNNISIHHNYIHDVIGEGLYIGNSFWQNGIPRTCNNQNIILYPHRIYGLKVYNNIIKNIGWDGIQYSCSPDAEVHDNIVENTGLLNILQQTSGVQVGGGSGGRFYNNIIRNPGSTGLAIIGFVDTMRVYNNLIVNAYEGIFVDTRDSIRQPKIELQIYNNTLVNMKDNGMKIYDNGYQYKNAQNQWVFFPKGYQPRVKNNVIIGPYFDFRLILRDPTITIDSSNNYKLRTPFSATPQYFIPQKLLLFEDTFSYQLKPNSYLIDRGTNAVSSIVKNDLLKTNRPQGNFYDLGAYEYLISNTAAIQRKGTISEFNIFPTNATEILHIELPQITEECELIISDIMGGIQLRQKLSESKQSQLLNVAVNQLQQGLYICILKNRTSHQFLKFFKY